MRPLGGLKGCSRLVKGSAGVGGGGRNGWKMVGKIEKSNISHNGEFWGSGDLAGSKERQILHYMVKCRPPENSARSIYENLMFFRALRGPLAALGPGPSPGLRGRRPALGAVKVPKKCQKIVENQIF